MKTNMATLWAGAKCSKFATGGVFIIQALIAAYLIYVALVFAIAYWTAWRRSKVLSSGTTRIWLVHMFIAALVAVGPVLPLIYLDVRAHIESVRWKKQFERDRANSVAWKNGLKFSPGSVRKDLDRAVATIPKPYLVQYGADVIEAPLNAARSDIKSRIVEDLEKPNAEWTKEDLDAFEGMADSSDIGITVLTVWARDRTNLPAVAALCSQATLAFSQSRDCKQSLGNAVSAWCRVDGARCEELANDDSFRKVVTDIAGVVLRR